MNRETVSKLTSQLNALAQSYNSPIPTSTLGKTGLEVGKLGLGTWEIGNQNTDPEDVRNIVAEMLDNGGNFIDTAHCYEGAEGILGEALSDFNRDDYVLLTKTGHKVDSDFDRVEGSSKHFTPEVMKSNVEKSLQELNTDYVDVLLIHTSGMDDLEDGAIIDSMIELQDEGKARYIGYSGDNEDLLYAASIPEFSVIEMSLSIMDMRNGGEILDQIKENGLGVVAKRPIANAFWRGKDLYSKAYDYSEEYRDRAEKMGFSVGDFSINWLKMAITFTMTFPIDVMAIGTTRLDHMRENIGIVSSAEANKELVNDIAEKFYEAQDKIENYKDNKVWLGLG